MQPSTDFRRNRLALLMLAGLGLILALMFLAPGSLPAAPVAAQSLNAAAGGTPLAPAVNYPVVHPAADGDLDTTFVDPQVKNDHGGQPEVYAMAQQPDGKIVIGGDIGLVAGQARSNVARLNSDGTLDATFPANTGWDWVMAMALQPDGKVLVAGRTAANSGWVGRLNSDGTPDTSFAPPWGKVNLGSGNIYGLALQPDGKIVIGGIGNALGTGYLARLNSNGTLDASFTAPNTNERVYALALQPDGKVLIGGAFTSVGGSTRKGVARLNANGTLDSSFGDPNLANLTNNVCKFAVPDEVPRLAACALALQSDGKVVIGGNFTSVGGQTRNLAARLNSDGTLDASFGNRDFVDVPNFSVRALALQADGKVHIAGTLVADVGGGQQSVHDVRLNSDGSVDTADRKSVV